MPFSCDVIHIVDARDKSFDQFPFAAKLWAGINGFSDGDKHLFILAVGVMILLYKHQDIIYVDFNLLDKFHFKNNIINNIGAFSLLVPTLPLIAQILISAQIILQVSFCNQLHTFKFIKRDEQIAHTQDCTEESDKILLVLFARNTVDSLTTVRKLKEKGIEIFFEKENIWTLDSKGELLITIMSSLAQEESRSISENCTWGQRKRFADGKVTVPFNRFLGYDRGEDGNLVVNPEQAATVRRIYSMFLQGMTPFGIASKLTADGVLSPGGKERWNAGAVRSILTNEKYRGDALLQKSYTVDFLTKKKKPNEGEIPQYYVEGNHEAIIAPDVFEAVQRELERRSNGRNRHSGVHLFSGKIKCGQCGSWYGSKVWHSTDKYRQVIWQCNHKFDNDERCTTPHFTDDEIKAFFISAVNKLLPEKDSIIKAFNTIKSTVFDTSDLDAEKTALEQEMVIFSEMMQQSINENARVALDQTEYQKRYDGLTERFGKAKARLEEVTAVISDKANRQATIEDFLRELQLLDGMITEFDPMLWVSLVNFVTVYSKDDVRVTFKDGTEIRA